MPTKIETSLTHEELMEFFKRCAQTKGGTTGPKIQALAEEFGVTISHESANNFRKGALEDYLEELNRQKDLAATVTEIAKTGAGLSDAAAAVLGERVLNATLQLPAEEVGTEKGNTISLAVARLQAGDRNSKRLAAELRIRDEQLGKLQRERTDWEEKRRQVAVQLELVKSAAPASADEVRAAAVEEIDRIMGLKK